MKAICVNSWVTARETSSINRVLLITPSDQTEAGHFIQGSEIYLTRKEIAMLAREFPEASDE